MQGTFCIAGSGLGICILTGDSTVFGRIAKHSSKRRSGMTTLQREILRFVLIIASAIAFFSIIVIILWASWLRVQHPDFLNLSGLIIAVVSVSVAFIPEGQCLHDSTDNQVFRWLLPCR
jgi:sodium/potassium-transporting ATPase subunit alpha